ALAEADRLVVLVGIDPGLEFGVADRRRDRVGVGVAMTGDVDRAHAGTIIACRREAGEALQWHAAPERDTFMPQRQARGSGALEGRDETERAMPSAPQILPTQVMQGTAPGVTY